MLYYENFDLINVVTPVKVDRLEQLLVESKYDPVKTKFLVDSFRQGFPIGYAGNMKVKKTAPNLKIRVGTEVDLWNKVMKEVKEKRYAGPFEEPPSEYYIQSLIGLVPKDNGKDTRLIFHLSYPRSGDSLNSETPRELCRVKYCEFDEAIRRCLEEGVGCHISHSDISAAFRNLGILPAHWKLLLMKARSPLDGKWYYFVDKCLPFGSSISSAHFLAVSDGTAHIVRYFAGKKITNYLDDFLFTALLRFLCNEQVQTFLWVCNEIGLPVNEKKTFWGTTYLIFLGLLIDTIRQIVCILVEKVERAKFLIDEVIDKKKMKIHQLQKLCDFLNFLC